MNWKKYGHIREYDKRGKALLAYSAGALALATVFQMTVLTKPAPREITEFILERNTPIITQNCFKFTTARGKSKDERTQAYLDCKNKNADYFARAILEIPIAMLGASAEGSLVYALWRRRKALKEEPEIRPMSILSL